MSKSFCTYRMKPLEHPSIAISFKICRSGEIGRRA